MSDSWCEQTAWVCVNGVPMPRQCVHSVCASGACVWYTHRQGGKLWPGGWRTGSRRLCSPCPDSPPPPSLPPLSLPPLTLAHSFLPSSSPFNGSPLSKDCKSEPASLPPPSSGPFHLVPGGSGWGSGWGLWTGLGWPEEGPPACRAWILPHPSC